MVRGLRAARRSWGCVPRASGDGPKSAWTTLGMELCSPRERGWSGRAGRGRRGTLVFPARAGMVRRSEPMAVPYIGVPRASGDGPIRVDVEYSSGGCSPRERGWSLDKALSRAAPTVFPARAGMVRLAEAGLDCAGRVPRASGDGPVGQKVLGRLGTCSPRERGWSPVVQARLRPGGVFPARAGMVRPWPVPATACTGVPRASGDGPQQQSRITRTRPCSPRERGWSGHRQRRLQRRQVFPARAGMVPRACGSVSNLTCVPRASGDGPTWSSAARPWVRCSPRERGWSGEPGAV